ncbi:7797_t:CDS:2 [Ambispora gerdemannii]|uniref:7797_t:CDS:1 n=1 Tax=Ambispora gerdemannii TaxID=144530 RepID=A0A9N8ZMX0_9GLOM|nr:7797_t:CDS:2 [Ambispora gerdemannii]
MACWSKLIVANFVFKTIIGTSPSFESSPNQIEEIIDRIDDFMEMMNYFCLIPRWIRYHLPWFKTRTAKYLNSKKQLDVILDEIIEQRIKAINNWAPDKALDADLLTLLLLVRDSIEKFPQEILRPFDRHEIQHFLIEIFLAGIDSTSSTICSIIYFVCKNPHVKKLLVEEIEKIFGPNLEQPVTTQSLNKLVYCEAVIKETNRSIPFVPITSRYSESPDELGGFHWPAGTNIGINIHGIHMNTLHWTDPHSFKPERFISADGNELVPETKNTFLMFGRGVRACMGRKLSMIIVKTFMVLIFTKYEVELLNEGQDLKIKYNGTNKCEEFFIHLKPRIR